MGGDGQALLSRAHVVMIGCGALGCVSADLLARAGVGRLTLVDRDVVELVNLQRQTLFDQSQIGLPKAEAAGARIAAVNDEVRVHSCVADVVASNAEELLIGDGAMRPAVLVDGTDNFEARFLLNDVSVKHDIPLVYGGGIGTEGAAGLFGVRGGPCLRCAFDGPPAPGSQPTCETAGVIGPATSAVGARQAVLAIQVIVDSQVIGGRLERFDIWTGDHTRVTLPRDPACPCCVSCRYEHLESDGSPAEAVLCGRDAVQIPASGMIDLEALAARLGGSFAAGPFMLRGKVEGERYELTVFGDGRTIVRGTRNVAEARSVHARYIGS